MEIVKRKTRHGVWVHKDTPVQSLPIKQSGFKVEPRRWVVERTFGWLGRSRRLAKEYDFLTQTSQNFIYIAMSKLLWLYVKEEIILKEVEKVLATLHLDPELLVEVISYIKASAKIEQDFHKRRIRELHAEHTKMKTRMDRLTDLFLDDDISKEEHENKRSQLIQRREDIRPLA